MVRNKENCEGAYKMVRNRAIYPQFLYQSAIIRTLKDLALTAMISR